MPIRSKNKQHTVLIVEDHSIVRMGLSTLISQLDDISLCSEAESGEKALEFLKNNKPDIVIVDISLRDMNGIDLIKYIKKIHSFRIIGKPHPSKSDLISLKLNC